MRLKNTQDQQGYGSLLKVALQQMIDSQETMQMIYRQWNSPSLAQSKVLFDALKSVMSNDEAMTQEYFGLNTLFVSSGKEDAFDDFMVLFETSLQMGSEVEKLLLQKVVECREVMRQNSYGQQEGITQREAYDFAKAVIYEKHYAI